MRLIANSAVLLAAAALAAPAQMVVSAHSGTLHYFEGDVSIDGVTVKSQPGHFEEIKEQSTLRTARGRAEILLTPGVFLRVGENSAVRMLDNRLASTRVEMVSGSATLEVDAQTPGDRYKTPPVTLVFKDYELQPVKEGLLEITTDPAQVRVYKGEALVEAGRSNRVIVKDGHEVSLAAALATTKFDEKVAADDNYLWARDRSAEISAANMSSARTIANSGSGYGFNGVGFGGPYWGSSLWGASMYGGGWYFNPLFGMYTYIPLDGFAFSPFGYGFYSPMVINSVYAPAAGTWYGAGGARTGGVVGRPISGPGGVTRGTGLNTSLRPSTSNANVISNRMATAAIARTGASSRGELSRPDFSRGNISAPGVSSGGIAPARSGGGFSGPSASPAGGGISRGGAMGGGGGGVRGR